MLEIRDLVKNYKDFHLSCSMVAKSGEVTALVGLNGAGKSTTFKSILNLISYDSGLITLFGKDSRKLTNEDKQKIGFVSNSSGFGCYLTIKDIISILASFYKEFDKEWFIEKCAVYELPMNKQLKYFSDGMQTKLKVLVALSHNAKLLILDEPTAGLDIIARRELLSMLQEYMEKAPDTAILISSHISSDLEEIGDSLYMIQEGKIVLHEDFDKLLNEYALLKVDKEMLDKLDKEHILRIRQEGQIYKCLTNERQFYLENFPQIVVEKANIDELVVMTVEGAKV